MPKRKPQTLDDKMPDLVIPLPDRGIGSEKWWQEEIEQSQKRRTKAMVRWREELDAYRDSKNDKAFGVNTNYANTEQKKWQLFYQTPEVGMTPLQNGLDELAPTAAAALNHFIGPKEINAKRLMDEVIFDMLVPAGMGPTELGYECEKMDGQIAELDPLTNQPLVDEKGQPVMKTVPDAIHVWSRFYWNRIPLERLLLPVGFMSTKYDDAPWIGWEFDLPSDRMSDRFGVGKDLLGAASYNADQTLMPAEDREFRKDNARGVKIWYRASLIDATVKNPELYRQIVFAKSREKHSCVKHENSPYQEFNDKSQFVKGMKGSPIHIFSIAGANDTQYQASNCAATKKLRDELSELFRIFKRQRQRSIPLRGFDKTGMDKRTIRQIESGEQQEMIGFDGPPGDKLVEIARAQLSQETFNFVTVYRDELARMWALGSNQQGAKQDTSTTATESELIQSWVETRLSGERERTLEQFVQGAEKLFACIQMYMSDQTAVQVLGQDGAKKLMMLNRSQIQGRYAFEIKPDSSIRINKTEERNQHLRMYNLLRQDPLINPAELIKPVALAFGIEPSKLILQPEPKKPDPPKVGLSLKGEDFMNPAVLMTLQAMGVPIPAEAIAAATLAAQTAVGVGEPLNQPPNTEHGGPAEELPPIVKHDADLTGQLEGPGPTLN